MTKGTTASISTMLMLTAKLVLLTSWAAKPAQSFHIPPSLISNPSRLLMGLNHDYKRDTSSDSSNVDVGAVDDLLGERLRARKTGDFAVADDIRDRLSSEYGVTVLDRDRAWTTGGGAGSRGGGGGGRGGRGGRGRGGRGGRGRGGRSSRDFGPRGHDYELCARAGPNASGVAEAAIHRMVAERLSAKMSRDFDAADRVQAELAEEGIFVDDRTREWRADGVRFVDPSEGRRAPSDRNRPYVRSRFSQTLPEDAELTLERVGELVAERTHWKKVKKFDKADSIKDALEQSCNVVIDDRVREWSIGGSFGRDADIKRAHNEALKSRSYAMSSSSQALPDGVTREDVQARVDARTRARNDRRYKESDALRDEILEQFNVVVHDAIKMWSVGGDFGSDDPVRARGQSVGGRERGSYIRRGGGNLKEDDVELIQDMLKERWEAKSNRNFDLADDIRSRLYDRYNVNVDDKESEWRVLSDDYAQTRAEAGARELDAEEASAVGSQLARRIVLKKNRDYEEADAIRDSLQNGYSILIDDKKHEWKVISSGRRGGLARAGAASRRVKDEVAHDPWFDDDDDSANGNDDDSNNDNDGTTAVTDADPEEEDTPSPPVMSKDELTSLTVPLLKEKLREAGKPVSGKKADLIDRLLA